ncbi:flagellin, partial [Methylobacterium sp. J-092]|uniref:flagellin n=1 Tax=Methylobacterium sp. J-092 TaxID=2836667 RepID=UPI0024447F5A
SVGLSLTAITGNSGASSNGQGNFLIANDVKTTPTSLTNPSATLRPTASTFGSNLSVVQNRQDFTKTLQNVLDTGASRLTDADLNEEAANSQALSTRQSLGISALSLANTAQQGILQLLR